MIEDLRANKEGNQGVNLCFICAAHLCLYTMRRLEEKITGLQQEDTGTIDFVPMSNKQVLTTNWPDNCADAGNMTKTDRLEYMAIMGSALHGN